MHRYTGKGPRRGHFGLGVDLAQLHDASAFVVVSACDVHVSETTAPVRHFVVEHIEAHQGSRAAPLMLATLARRATSIARSFPTPFGGPCAMAFDQHLAVEFSALVQKEGYRPVADVRDLAGARFHQASMAVPAQTARFRHLREIVHGGRLHIPDTNEGRELAKQLRGLRAWEMPTGLKVEGKRDDLADALVLAIEIARYQPPTDGDGAVEQLLDGVSWSEEGVQVRSRWVRRLADGRTVPAEIPAWDPAFEAHARECIRKGIRTPQIDRWLESIGIDASRVQIDERELDEARPLGRM